MPKEGPVARESVILAREVARVLVARLLIEIVVVDQLGAPLLGVFVPNLISITYLLLTLELNPLKHFNASDKF